MLAHSEKSQALTIAFWVRAQEDAVSSNYLMTPLFTAYAAAPSSYGNTWPMMACQYRGGLQVNCSGWSDYTDEQNVAGENTYYNGDTDWLADHKWHYYTAVFEDENAKVFFDGVLKNEWNNDGVTNTQKGLFTGGAYLKYVCLGGNQAWDWNDNDAPFDFARLLIQNSSMTPDMIKAQMTTDFPGWEDYLNEEPDAVEDISVTPQNENDALYNTAGQQVDDDYQGIVIKNGKKYLKLERSTSSAKRVKMTKFTIY